VGKDGAGDGGPGEGNMPAALDCLHCPPVQATHCGRGSSWLLHSHTHTSGEVRDRRRESVGSEMSMERWRRW
jgi:hypothetical protein